MAELTPHDLLVRGLHEIDYDSDSQKRWDFYEGRNDKPFAPKGVNTEYEALRQMAMLPLTRLAVRTPVQRLSMVGVRVSDEDSSEVDDSLNRVMRFNKLPSRQRILYIHSLVYGYGVASVWPNKDNKDTPYVYVEDPRNVYLHLDPSNPYSTDWAVKTWQETPTKAVAVLYTDAMVYRFEAEVNEGTIVQGADFEPAGEYANPMRRVPFVVFAPERRSDGGVDSMIDALIPQQRAIDTMRFNVLLAAQFAAFRQRVVVGYDPVQRDSEGNPVFKQNADGTPVLDANGQPVPIVNSPGRAGVDRMIVFPGADTNVFDMEESNLNNYVTVLDMLVATFASTAQVPPQYLVGDFKNVSGDLMTATEATLRSFVGELQTQFSDSWLAVFDLVNLARGAAELEFDAQIVWADATPLDLSQVSDAVSKMVPQGAPLEMFLEMLPGATPQRVRRWMGMSTQAMTRQMAGSLATAAFGPKAVPEPLADGDEDGTTA